MTRRNIVLGAALAAILLTAACGCDALVSPERQMLRFLKNLQVQLNNSQWDRAAKYCTRDCEYYPLDAKAAAPIAAFFKSMETMKLRLMFVVHVEKTTRVNDQKYVLQVRFQQRTGDMTYTQNYYWNGTMIWVKVGEEWRLKELKETSPREQFRS